MPAEDSIFEHALSKIEWEEDLESMTHETHELSSHEMEEFEDINWYLLSTERTWKLGIDLWIEVGKWLRRNVSWSRRDFENGFGKDLESIMRCKTLVETRVMNIKIGQLESRYYFGVWNFGRKNFSFSFDDVDECFVAKPLNSYGDITSEFTLEDDWSTRFARDILEPLMQREGVEWFCKYCLVISSSCFCNRFNGDARFT